MADYIRTAISQLFLFLERQRQCHHVPPHTANTGRASIGTIMANRTSVPRAIIEFLITQYIQIMAYKACVMSQL